MRKLLTTIVLALAATTAAQAQLPPAANNTQLAPTNGQWIRALHLYTGRPTGDQAWIAKLLAQYGQQPLGHAVAGVPTTFLVFQIIPGTRSIAAIGYGAECEMQPNGKNQTLAGNQCPLTMITVYADGRVNARTDRPACYLWIDPAGGPSEPDARTNGNYMRYDPQSGAIQVTTIVNGKPQSGCQGSIHA